MSFTEIRGQEDMAKGAEGGEEKFPPDGFYLPCEVKDNHHKMFAENEGRDHELGKICCEGCKRKLAGDV